MLNELQLLKDDFKDFLVAHEILGAQHPLANQFASCISLILMMASLSGGRLT